MVMASVVKVILGCTAFVVFWILAVFPSVPLLPIGRTAGSLLGAMLMVAFKVVSPEQAFAAVDLPILGLLFGTMVVSVYLERADMFKHLGNLLSWRSGGARDLLCRICVVAAASSAVFTNDTACVVLTEFVLKLARRRNLPPHPFLLALASSANIGSSATPIGNPQNLVIAVLSGISFGEFLRGVAAAALAGVAVNTAALLAVFWNVLENKDEDDGRGGRDDRVVASVHRFSPATMSHSGGGGDDIEGLILGGTRRGEEIARKEENGVVWKCCVYMVTVGMLAALLFGFNMSWTAISAALVLVVLDFQDAQQCLEKVSYSLLIFFCGMFITVDGFNKTGIPSTLWELIEPYAKIDRPTGIAILALVILGLCNLASNVPTVLLLGARVAASAAAISAVEEKKAWLILAWVSTVAGNLSLLGSAANLIVCEQARRAPQLGYNLSFWTHLKFGLPSTIIITAIGLTLIR